MAGGWNVRSVSRGQAGLAGAQLWELRMGLELSHSSLTVAVAGQGHSMG